LFITKTTKLEHKQGRAFLTTLRFFIKENAGMLFKAIDSISGVEILVWAPNAERVSIV